MEIVIVLGFLLDTETFARICGVIAGMTEVICIRIVIELIEWRKQQNPNIPDDFLNNP